MTIREIASIICHPGCADQDTKISIYHYSTYHHKDICFNNPLWKGEAKDLKNQDDISDYIIVELLVDNSPEYDHLPSYNKGKIITVV